MPLFDKQSKIAFIGAGLVGGSLAVSMSQNGYDIVATASRTYASAQSLAERIEDCKAYETIQDAVYAADLVFISTIDDAIEPVASGLNWRSGQGVVHNSGATSVDVFDHPAQQGAVPGALHPLQAFSSVENGVRNMPGITFAIEGSPEMQESLAEIAKAMGGNPVFLTADDKVLYHASGVIIGNLLTGLAATAAQLWDKFGSSREDGIRALVPMMHGVAENLTRSGMPTSISGPYVRGDFGTMTKHLNALKERAPEVLPLYCELALSSLQFSVEKGAITEETAQQIRELIESHRRQT